MEVKNGQREKKKKRERERKTAGRGSNIPAWGTCRCRPPSRRCLYTCLYVCLLPVWVGLSLHQKREGSASFLGFFLVSSARVRTETTSTVAVVAAS